MGNGNKNTEKNRKNNALVGLHDGHRMRMYQKLDSQSLCDHEYLEILLFNAVPRKNTNDLAHRLLFEFGSVQGVFNASYERLLKVDGVGVAVASYIVCIGQFAPRLLASKKSNFPANFLPREFGGYAVQEYGKLQEEVFDVYFVDEYGKPFERKRIHSSKDSTVEVRTKWLHNILADSQPSGIVLVHNHPKGNATPSHRDDITTEKCQYLCNSAGVLLCDHLIYAPDGLYSYYGSGVLVEISSRCCALQNRGFTAQAEGE